MKSSKEFFEKMKTDEAFAAEVGAKIKEKINAGAEDYKAAWIPVAAEYGYELTESELEDIMQEASKELSEEELGKVAGGTTPTIAISISIASFVSYMSIKKIIER